MVAIAELPAVKVWSTFAVVPGGLIRVYSIGRTVQQVMPKLLERAARYRSDGQGELFAKPEVFGPATVAFLNEWKLLTADRWSLEELAMIAEQEITFHTRAVAVHNIRAERIASDLLFLQRQIIQRT